MPRVILPPHQQSPSIYNMIASPCLRAVSELGSGCRGGETDSGWPSIPPWSSSSPPEPRTASTLLQQLHWWLATVSLVSRGTWSHAGADTVLFMGYVQGHNGDKVNAQAGRLLEDPSSGASTWTHGAPVMGRWTGSGLV